MKQSKAKNWPKLSVGFTLVELILAIGISSVVGVLLLVIIVNSTGLFYNQSSKLSEGLNINDALSKIKSSVRLANSVASSYTNEQSTFTSGETQLVFKVSSIDSANNIIPDVYDYYVFYLNQKQLRLKVFPDTSSFRKAQDQIFSTNVDSLKFQYFDSASPPGEVAPNIASKIRVTLTLKQNSGLGSIINTATAEANLRNN